MSEDVRPLGCPDDYVKRRCVNCMQIAWIDPTVEQECVRQGKQFFPTCGAECAQMMTMRLSASPLRKDPPLQLNERIPLSGNLYARFDGALVIIETSEGILRMRLTVVAMARLFYLNRRICDTFPEKWVINLWVDE